MRVRLSNHQSKQEKNTQYKQTHQQTPPSRSVLLSVLLKTTRKTHTKFMLIKILGNEHINL